MLIAAVAGSRPQLSADEPPRDEVSLRESAKAVYEGLLSELQASSRLTVPDVESVAEWSKRIMIAEISPYLQMFETAPKGIVPPLIGGERMHDSLLEHSGRMKSLERIINAKMQAGVASRTELAAAKFFRLEIDRLLAKVEKEAKRIADSLELPKADLDLSLDGYEKLTIDVDANSEIWLEKSKLTFEQLTKKLKEFAARNEKSAMIVRANGKARVTVTEAISRAAHDCGVKKIMYVTRAEE